MNSHDVTRLIAAMALLSASLDRNTAAQERTCVHMEEFARLAKEDDDGGIVLESAPEAPAPNTPGGERRTFDSPASER